MASEKETVADILREMRLNDTQMFGYEGTVTMHVRTWRELCARIEAAHKREREATRDKSSQVGNAEMCKRDNDKPMTLDEAIAHAEEAVNDTPCGREHRQLADWLKELREIKNSNVAKMREALTQIHPLATSRGAWDIATVADTALKSPPRQCDIGTVDEQARRFNRYCSRHHGWVMDCSKCKLRHSVSCELAWSQLPCKKGDNNV